MGSVFISHASEDKGRLTPVLEGLLRKDVTLFVDHPELVKWSSDVAPRVKDMVRAIGKGRWRPIIEEALDACDIVAGAVSSGAMKQRADVPDQRVVKDEFDIAQGLAKFVPFKIDNVSLGQSTFLGQHNMRYFNLASPKDTAECVDWICAARQQALQRRTSSKFQFWADKRAASCQRFENGREQMITTFMGEPIRLNYVPSIGDGSGYYISKWTAGPQREAAVHGVIREMSPFGVDVPTYAELKHALWPEGCLITEANPFGIVRDMQDVLHWVSDRGRLAIVNADGKPKHAPQAFLRLKF